MIRTRLSLTSTAAFASLLGAAVPAFAQVPMAAPAPMMAPAPVMAPAMQPPPMMPPPAPDAVMPVAPVVPPKAADDMSGSVGFGVGVVAGNSLVKPDTGNLSMKYWMNDGMALLPKLDFTIGKVKGADATWKIAPSLALEFGLIKGASTRFNAVVGVGISAGKQLTTVHNTTTNQDEKVLPKDATISLFIPAGLNVEHFFTRWFSMGMGAYFNLVDFSKTGDAWNFDLNVSNVYYVGSLFIYTD